MHARTATNRRAARGRRASFRPVTALTSIASGLRFVFAKVERMVPDGDGSQKVKDSLAEVSAACVSG